MNPLRIVVLLVALGAAAGAALLLGGFFSKQKATAQTAAAVAAVPMTEVLVLARDVNIGQTVAAEDLTWRKWPKEAVAPGFISKDVNPSGLENMVGSVARAVTYTGEPATETKLIRAENASFMAAMLTPGMRAVAVELSEQSGAGGFILPNDRVDVIFAAQKSSDDGSSTSNARILLQDIRVLAIGQSASGGATAQPNATGETMTGKTATLEVSPAEAELLQRAAAAGSLTLALRGLTKADEPAPVVRTPAGDSSKHRGSTAITLVRNGEMTTVQAGN